MTEKNNKIEFRKAVRENVGLWINLIGGTGSGKTFSAMKLASGICGDKPFALIDTENRRGLHYADAFNFHHADLQPPFSPAAYTEAILAADAAGYPVIVVDSGTHCWSGQGGVLEMHEAEVDRMAGDGDWKRREAVKMAAWIKPKTEHKKMVQALLRVKAHIILCLRAEEKVEMVKGANGKTEIRAKKSLTGLDGWIPVCDKNLPFEATVSFLLTADRPGMPHPIKLQEQHKSIFPLDKPISAESGKLLAQWAAGGKAKAVPTADEVRTKLITAFGEKGINREDLSAYLGKPIEQAEPSDISGLRDIYAAITKGGKTWSDYMPAENVSEVTTESEDATVCAALRARLFEMVEGPEGWGILQIGTGQKARYKNRENLDQAELQKLVDELAK
jgi:hypothetical protein